MDRYDRTEGCSFNKKDEELAKNFCSVVAIAIAFAKSIAGAEGSVGLAHNVVMGSNP